MTPSASFASGRRQGATDTAWMTTFADLLALLLTFFVLLFSMNTVQDAQWRSVVRALKLQFAPHEARILRVPEPEAEAIKRFVRQAKSLDYLAALFRHKLSDDARWQGARLSRLGDRVVLSLPADLVFDSGSAALTADARNLLGDLGELLRSLDNAISVAGHTDPAPISGGRYASNWDLSLRRAEAVAAALREAGYGRPVTALGYGDGRFSDLSSALTEAERFRLARRVDVVVESAEARR